MDKLLEIVVNTSIEHFDKLLLSMERSKLELVALYLNPTTTSKDNLELDCAIVRIKDAKTGFVSWLYANPQYWCKPDPHGDELFMQQQMSLQDTSAYSTIKPMWTKAMRKRGFNVQ